MRYYLFKYRNDKWNCDGYVEGTQALKADNVLCNKDEINYKNIFRFNSCNCYGNEKTLVKMRKILWTDEFGKIINPKDILNKHNKEKNKPKKKKGKKETCRKKVCLPRGHFPARSFIKTTKSSYPMPLNFDCSKDNLENSCELFSDMFKDKYKNYSNNVKWDKIRCWKSNKNIVYQWQKHKNPHKSTFKNISCQEQEENCDEMDY